MTIRELFSCIDTDSCTRIMVRPTNHTNIDMFVDWENPQDPDFNVFDRIADMRINFWYVTCDGMIRITSNDPIDRMTAEFIEEVL